MFFKSLKDENYPEGFKGKDDLGQQVLNEVSLGVLRSLPPCIVTNENSNMDAVVKNDDSKSLLLERLTLYKGNMYSKYGLLGTISPEDFDDYSEYSFVQDFYAFRENLNALNLALSFFDRGDKFISFTSKEAEEQLKN